jgi:hypothetical protein
LSASSEGASTLRVGILYGGAPSRHFPELLVPFYGLLQESLLDMSWRGSVLSSLTAYLFFRRTYRMLYR